MATPIVQFAVRLDPALHTQLTALARAERRSVNSEVIRAIEKHVASNRGENTK
jgi:predicted HicB family RNase H-like nuclease